MKNLLRGVLSTMICSNDLLSFFFHIQIGSTDCLFIVSGPEVLLFGLSENGKINMETIANHIDSTPYVLATGIGGRTRRIYKD